MTTRSDLLGMMTRLSAAAESLGFLKDSELILQEGGPGRPYRLYQRKPPATKVSEPLDGRASSYLGFTKSNAYDRLHAMASTLEAVKDLQR